MECSEFSFFKDKLLLLNVMRSMNICWDERVTALPRSLSRDCSLKWIGWQAAWEKFMTGLSISKAIWRLQTRASQKWAQPKPPRLPWQWAFYHTPQCLCLLSNNQKVQTRRGAAPPPAVVLLKSSSSREGGKSKLQMNSTTSWQAGEDAAHAAVGMEANELYFTAVDQRRCTADLFHRVEDFAMEKTKHGLSENNRHAVCHLEGFLSLKSSCTFVLILLYHNELTYPKIQAASWKLKSK